MLFRSDSAIFKKSKCAGIGAVVHANSCGDAMAALSRRITFHYNGETIKALPLRKAVSFALEIGFNLVEFEGNSEYKRLYSFILL